MESSSLPQRHHQFINTTVGKLLSRTLLKESNHIFFIAPSCKEILKTRLKESFGLKQRCINWPLQWTMNHDLGMIQLCISRLTTTQIWSDSYIRGCQNQFGNDTPLWHSVIFHNRLCNNQLNWHLSSFLHRSRCIWLNQVFRNIWPKFHHVLHYFGEKRREEKWLLACSTRKLNIIYWAFILCWPNNQRAVIPMVVPLSPHFTKSTNFWIVLSIPEQCNPRIYRAYVSIKPPKAQFQVLRIKCRS